MQKAYIGDGDAHKALQAKRKPVDHPKVLHVLLPDGTFETAALVVSELEQERAGIQNADSSRETVYCWFYY